MSIFMKYLDQQGSVSDYSLSALVPLKYLMHEFVQLGCKREFASLGETSVPCFPACGSFRTVGDMGISRVSLVTETRSGNCARASRTDVVLGLRLPVSCLVVAALGLNRMSTGTRGIRNRGTGAVLGL